MASDTRSLLATISYYREHLNQISRWCCKYTHKTDVRVCPDSANPLSEWCPSCYADAVLERDSANSGRDVFLLCRRAVKTTQAFIECGKEPTLDPGGSSEYQRKRRDMERAHIAAVTALEQEEPS